MYVLMYIYMILLWHLHPFAICVVVISVNWTSRSRESFPKWRHFNNLEVGEVLYFHAYLLDKYIHICPCTLFDMDSYDPKLFRWSSSSPGFPWLPRLKMSVPLMSDRKNLTNVQHFLYQTYQMKDEDIWVAHLINLPTLWKAVFSVVLHVLPENSQDSSTKTTPHLAETDWTSRSYALIITVLGFPTASEYEIIGEAKKRSTGRGKKRRNFTPPQQRCCQRKATGCWGQVSWKLHPGLLRTSKTYNRFGWWEPDEEKRLLSSQVAVDVECRCFFPIFLLWR